MPQDTKYLLRANVEYHLATFSLNLSLSHIESAASPQSFSRGKTLARGAAVQKVQQNGLVYTAEVQGTFRYVQTLDIGQVPIYAACTCPFSGNGWCKHLVAVACVIFHPNPESTSGLDSLVSANTQPPPQRVVGVLQIQQARKTFAIAEASKPLVWAQKVNGHLMQVVDQGHISLALAMLVGAREAISVSSLVDKTPFIAAWQEAQTRLLSQVPAKPDAKEGQAMATLFTQRWSRLRARGDNANWDLLDLDPSWTWLGQDPIVARTLLQRLEAFQHDAQGLEPVLIRTAKQAQSATAYRLHARVWTAQNLHAAEEMITFLAEYGGETTLLDEAQRLYAIHGETLLPILEQHLTPDMRTLFTGASR